MGIRWQEYITNTEVLEKANSTSIEAMLMTRQLRWAGHLSRMEDTRLPKAVFYGELKEGKRDRGAPRKRYKDQLRRQLKAADIPEDNWETCARSRESWRGQIKRGSTAFEINRREALVEKRRKRKEPKPSEQSLPTQVFPCPRCNRLCRSRIGLHSHMRACQANLQPSH